MALQITVNPKSASLSFPYPLITKSTDILTWKRYSGQQSSIQQLEL